MKTDGIDDINELDNISQTTKVPFITAINEGYESAVATINAASTTDDIDTAIEAYAGSIDEQIAAAEAINYRP